MMTRGDALDQALGLLRAPSRRGALRARPLPPGVTEVLSIAGGSEDSVAAAAARTGYGAPELTEAARFFVQQVLLAEDANAYRVLGVMPDADGAQIRDHHRLLMRWLHPDRSGDERWESALATRVNTAWAQLRSDVARSAYDDALALQPVPSLPDGRGVRRQVAVPGRDAGARVERGHQGAIAVAALGLVCAGLAWLAIQRESRLDAERDASIASLLPAAKPSRSVDREAFAGVRAEVLTAATPAQPAPTPAPAPVPPPAPSPTPAMQWADGANVAVDPPDPVHDIEGNAPAAGQAGRTSRTASVAAGRAVEPAVAQPPARRRAASAVPVVPAPAPAATIPEDTHDPVQLMRQARLAVDQAIEYLAVGAGPVAWQDAQAERAAALARDALDARLQAGDRDRRIRLQTPDWRMDAQRASLRGRYRVSSRLQALETGRVHVELLRRDARWWVSSLRMEPGQ